MLWFNRMTVVVELSRDGGLFVSRLEYDITRYSVDHVLTQGSWTIRAWISSSVALAGVQRSSVYIAVSGIIPFHSFAKYYHLRLYLLDFGDLLVVREKNKQTFIVLRRVPLLCSLAAASLCYCLRVFWFIRLRRTWRWTLMKSDCTTWSRTAKERPPRKKRAGGRRSYVKSRRKWWDPCNPRYYPVRIVRCLISCAGIACACLLLGRYIW